MDTLRWMVLEDVRTPIVVLGLVEIVLVLFWRSRRSRGLMAAMIAVPLLAAGFGAADLLVETDRERLDRTLQKMGDAIHGGDVDAAMRYVSEDYKSGRYRKKNLRRLAAVGLDKFVVAPETPTIDLRDGTAVITQNADIVPKESGPMPLNYRTVTWRATFRMNEAGEWRLVEAELLRPRSGSRLEQQLPLLRRLR